MNLDHLYFMLMLSHSPTISILTSMMIPATWSASLYKSFRKIICPPTGWPSQKANPTYVWKSLMKNSGNHLVGMGTRKRNSSKEVSCKWGGVLLRELTSFYTVDFLRANHIGTGKSGKTPKQHSQGMCCAHALKLPGSRNPSSGAGWARN